MKPPRTPWIRYLTSAGLLGLATSTAYAIPVFPGAVGFGTQTPAGRGGVVRRVTTLANSGTGSLRDAVENPAYGFPRVVIFDVSGIINLQGPIRIHDGQGRITIAGQTAPAPGIMLEGAGFSIQGDDVLIQHLAVRPGVAHPTSPSLENRDCFAIEAGDTAQDNVNNVVLDHVSCSWSTDEIVSTWGNNGGTLTNVTLSNCIFAEALRYPGRTDSHANNPPAGGHSAGILFGRGTNGASMLRSVSAWNSFRNPYINYNATNIQVVNNYVYSPGMWTGQKMQFSVDTGPTIASLKGNITALHNDSSSNTHTDHLNVKNTAHAASIYQENNRLFNSYSSAWLPNPVTDQWNTSVTNLSGRTVASVRLTTEPAVFTALGVATWDGTTTALRDQILENAGARPAQRDPVDTRIIADIKAGVVRDWVDNPGQVGGYPAWSQILRSPGIALPANPNTDTDGNGYTQLEDWLHGLAADLEVGGGGGGSMPINSPIATFDTFTDGNSLGWTAAGATAWSIASGAYRQSNTSGGARAILSGTNWTNQVVEAKVKPVSFNGTNRFCAVYARYRDINNAYYVALRSNNTVELKKIVNGVPTTFGSPAAFTVATGTTYKVRLSIAGTSLSATVTGGPSGSVTLTATDSALTAGSTAIGTFMASADFDDVSSSPFPASVSHVTDDFDDTNSTGWDTTWTGVTGTWSVVADGSQVLRQGNATAAGRAIWNGTTLPSANQSIQVDIKPLTFTGSSFVAVYTRFLDINTAYYAALRNTKVLELKKILNGTPTTLATLTLPSSFNLTQWHTLRLETTGTTTTTLKAYLDGTLLSATDNSSPITAVNKAGVGTFSASAEFDDILISSP